MDDREIDWWTLDSGLAFLARLVKILFCLVVSLYLSFIRKKNKVKVGLRPK